jgi:hypothetical protein
MQYKLLITLKVKHHEALSANKPNNEPMTSARRI